MLFHMLSHHGIRPIGPVKFACTDNGRSW